MQASRRQFLGSMAGLSLTGLPMVRAVAKEGDDYPVNTIKMIVSFSGGSNTDIAGRIWAEVLSKQLGQSVVIENRPGAGGNIGAMAAARSAPDGYTLFYSTATTYAINPFVYPSLNYEPTKDFVTAAVTISVPVVLVVSGDSKIRDFDGLVSSIKVNPDQFSYGSNGAGTSSHIACKVFAERIGHPDLLHVPYKQGSQQVMSDVMGGRLTYAVDAWSVVGPLIKAGRLRAIGVSSQERLSVAPDIPTFTQLLGKECVVVTWNAIWAPTGTPKSILAKLHAVISKGRADQKLIQQFENQGTPMLPEMSLEESERFMQAEVLRWKGFVEEAKIRI